MEKMAAPLSPSLCKPQSLDRERLKMVLSAEQYQDVRYHEPVVWMCGGTKAFKLLVLGPRAIHFFPLAKLSTAPLTIAMASVACVERVAPSQMQKKGMMLHEDCDLFRITCRSLDDSAAREKRSSSGKATEYFVSSFEPCRHAFFFVSCAHRSFFQLEILQPPSSSMDMDLDELADLFQQLLSDLVAERDRVKQSAMLRELGVVCVTNMSLKRLLLLDRTSVSGSSSATACSGFVVFLLAELALEPTREHSVMGFLEYVLSILQLLYNVFFNGYTLPERRSFIYECPLPFEELIALLSHPFSSKRLSQHLRAPEQIENLKALTDEITDAQAALMLELHQMKLESAQFDGQSASSHRSIPEILCSCGFFHQWFKKFFKRVATSVSHAKTEYLQIQSLTKKHPRIEGTAWSLLVWRHLSLLLLLLDMRAGVVAPMIRHRYSDLLTYYLKDSASMSALSRVPFLHAVECVKKLERILLICEECGS